MDNATVNKILFYFLLGVIALIVLTVILYLVVSSSITTAEQLSAEAIVAFSVAGSVLEEILLAGHLQTEAAILGGMFAITQASTRYGGQVVAAALNTTATIGAQSARLLGNVGSATASVVAAGGSKAIGLLGQMISGLTTLGGTLVKEIMPMFAVVVVTGVVADIYDVANTTINGAAGHPLCGP